MRISRDSFLNHKGALVAILAISPYFIGIAMQIFFANKLSVEQVGIFAAMWIFMTMVLVFTNWNGDKYIISKKNIDNKSIDETFTFELIFSILLYLVLLFFFRDSIDNFLRIETSNLFWLGIFFISIYYPLVRTKALLEKKLHYISAYSPAFLANIFASIIGIIFFVKGYGLWSMVIWKISVYVIEFLILYFIVVHKPKVNLNFKKTKNIIGYCWPIFFGGCISFMGTNIDKFLITILLDERELGIYWLAFSLSHMLIILRELISKLLLPILAIQDSDKSKISIFEKLNAYIQLFGVLSSILVTFWIDEVFYFILGEKWMDAVPIFIVLYYAAVFKLIAGASASLLFSVARTRIAFDISIISLFIFAPLMYIGIHFGGLFGASVSVLVSTILINIIAFETAVKGFASKGYLSYYAYVLINIFFLYLLVFAFNLEILTVTSKLTYSALAIIFAFIMLPLNNVYKKIIST